LNVKTKMNDEMNDRKKSENTKSSFLFNLHKGRSNKKVYFIVFSFLK
jgi:hypothetical protein